MKNFFIIFLKKKNFKVDLSNFFLITNSLKKLENFENLTVLKKPFYFDTFLESNK